MFRKPTFTIRSFLSTAVDLFLHTVDLTSAVLNHQVDRRFASELMLAVAQVDGCLYSNSIRCRAALRSGVSAGELQQIMAGELGQFPLEQAVAMMFAQHYTEQDGRPYPAAWQSIQDYYGGKTARDILAYIRVFYFIDRLANTLETIFHRSNIW